LLTTTRGDATGLAVVGGQIGVHVFRGSRAVGLQSYQQANAPFQEQVFIPKISMEI
jgi:hypothetical protein